MVLLLRDGEGDRTIIRDDWATTRGDAVRHPVDTSERASGEDGLRPHLIRLDGVAVNDEPCRGFWGIVDEPFTRRDDDACA